MRRIVILIWILCSGGVINSSCLLNYNSNSNNNNTVNNDNFVIDEDN